jgi:hypothetical protein
VALARIGCGVAGGLAAAAAAFREQVFDPRTPAAAAVLLTVLFAGLLALVRARLLGVAVALALVGGAAHGALEGPFDPLAVVARALGGLGALLVAVVFDALARDGYRFGKFLIAGPLLGGVLLALSPLTVFHDVPALHALRPLLFEVYLGVVVGDGVALGVELAEAFPATAADDEAVARG